MSDMELLNHCKRHGLNIALHYTSGGKFYMSMSQSYGTATTSHPLKLEITKEELEREIYSLEKELHNVAWCIGGCPN